MRSLKSALAALPLLLAATTAAAQEAAAEDRRHMVSIGWLHIDNRPDSDPLATRSASGTSVDVGTRFTFNDADTVALIYTHQFNDHVSAQFVGGVPPVFHLRGQGSSALVGDLGAYGDLAKARQWSPALLALYTFRDPRHALRPFIGLGVTYTRFADIQLNPALEQAFVNAVQASTMGAAQQVSVASEADDSWDPVGTIGVEYRFAPRWYAIASVAYVPLDTSATVTSRIERSASPAVPTGEFTRSWAAVEINPVVGFLGVGYRL